MHNQHVTYLASVLRHGKNACHAVFPSCALYIDDKFAVSFDLDFELDVPTLKKYSKDHGITLFVLIEFDAMRSPSVLVNKNKYLIQFHNGSVTYGVEYELILNVLKRKHKK